MGVNACTCKGTRGCTHTQLPVHKQHHPHATHTWSPPQDLLQPENKNLSLRETPDGGVYVEGVRAVEVTSLEGCIQLLTSGDANRWVGVECGVDGYKAMHMCT